MTLTEKETALLKEHLKALSERAASYVKDAEAHATIGDHIIARMYEELAERNFRIHELLVRAFETQLKHGIK